MKKIILIALSMALGVLFGLYTSNAMAQSAVSFETDGGLYYDVDRNGEGMMALTDETRIVGYFYTYGQEQCESEPEVSPSLENGGECDLNGQRWFFFADDLVEGEAEGNLYHTKGVNYPEGQFDKSNPFGVIVGAAKVVGTYYLREAGDGYELVVLPLSGMPDDPLYFNVFYFTTRLF